MGSQSQGSNNTSGWAGIQHGFYQASIMQNMILLDNGSTDTIFCNPALVTNIRKVDKILTLNMNAGVLQMNLKVDVPGWGEVWFDSRSITNIFSCAQMADHYQITYDNKEDAFFVHLPNKQVRFTRQNFTCTSHHT